MKTNDLRIGICTVLFLTTSLFNSVASADYNADVQAISSLQGCYKVDFTFKELKTLIDDPQYKPSPDYKSSIIELAFLDQNNEQGVHLQHILMLPGGHGLIKHWRQEWTYQPTNLLIYRAPNHWQKIPHAQTEGKWSQAVRSVDDSPRSVGISTWTHTDEAGSSWGKLKEEYARAPLPRREQEFGRRDYQLLERSHQITTDSKGWVMEESNIKVRQGADGEVPLAVEEGRESHTKVDAALCAQAVQWWKESKPAWDEIRAAWDETFHRFDVIRLKPVVENKRLGEKLNALADEAKKEAMPSKTVREKASALIQSYLE